MSEVTFWHDPETDQWTVRDGIRTETISPLLREAFTYYHQREMQDMRRENDDLIDEAAAIREQNDRLRELVRDMWRFTGTACEKYPRLFDPAAQGGQMVKLNMIDVFEQRMRELEVEVD